VKVEAIFLQLGCKIDLFALFLLRFSAYRLFSLTYC